MQEVIKKIKELYEEEERRYEFSANNMSRNDGFSRMCAYGVCLDILENYEVNSKNKEVN